MSVLGQLYVAALAALALAAAGTAPGSYAWIAPSTTQHTRLGRTAPISSFPTLPSSSSSLIVGHMASRTATKWEKKQEWLENRDFDSLRGGAAADSSSSSVPFAAIVGNGRIGSTLAQAGNCVVVGRDDKIDPDGTGPILIATRNDALDGIIDACPPGRRKDLVFMQNGYLDDFLSSKGLLDNTQILLYLSVTAKGADPIDGVTSVNPEGLTAAVGEHAQAFADRLKGLDLKCNVVTPEVYRPAMFEKLMWISTYMLVGTAKECKTVGEAGSQYGDVVAQVVEEMVRAVSARENIVFPDGTLERLRAYTDVVADFPCAVKEFEWRNKYFWDLGDDAVPTHNALLKECKDKGFLGFDLP